MKKHLVSLFSAIAMSLVCGCASSYKFGTTLPEELRDVYFVQVLNESDQPNVASELRRAIEKEIRRESTLRMVPESEATTRLEVVVTDYDQQAASYDRKNTQDPNRFKMRLTARVSFVRMPRPQAGIVAASPIWEKSAVSADKTFSGGSRSLEFKQQCLPEVAKELAETIVDGCIGAW